MWSWVRGVSHRIPNIPCVELDCGEVEYVGELILDIGSLSSLNSHRWESAELVGSYGMDGFSICAAAGDCIWFLEEFFWLWDYCGCRCLDGRCDLEQGLVAIFLLVLRILERELPPSAVRGVKELSCVAIICLEAPS